MRLFIAVCFSSGIKSRLLQIQNRIKAQAARGNFSRPENLHLTLVFIGETPDSKLPLIRSAIEKALLPPPAEFTLDFDRVGCFRRGGTDLWWIGADTPRLVTSLRNRLTAEFAAAGIAFDTRPFKAHITLAREVQALSPLVIPDEKISVPIQRISLMKSEHSGGRLIYTEIAGRDLEKK